MQSGSQTRTEVEKSDMAQSESLVPNNTTVLIVEDDKTLLSVEKYNFTKEGYSVLTAEDGVTALELARS